MWLLLIILPLAFIGLHFILRTKPLISPAVIGHRGAGGLAPENTLAAIKVAIQHQAAGAEIDVQRSADGVLLLMHDTTVDRTTNGSGAIVEMTWEQLRQLDAGSHFSPEFAGEPIPSLEETLTLLQPHTTTLVIEVKDPELYPNLAPDLVAVIEKLKAQKQVIVISFDTAWIADFSNLAPDIPVGLLYYWTGSPPQISQAKMVGVLGHLVFLDPSLVRRLHQAGFPVAVFGIDNPLLMRLLLWLGVDNIITDRPDVWVEVSQ